MRIPFFFLLTIALFNCYSCQEMSTSTPPPVADSLAANPEAKLMKFKGDMALLDIHDVHAPIKILDYFTKNFTGASKEVCDAAFAMVFIKMKEIAVQQTKQLKGEYTIIKSDLMQGKEADMNYDQVTQDLYANGMTFGLKKDEIQVIPDLNYYQLKYGRFFSPMMKEFLSLRPLDIAPLKPALAVAQWKSFIINNPECPLTDEAIKQYKLAMNTLLPAVGKDYSKEKSIIEEALPSIQDSVLLVNMKNYTLQTNNDSLSVYRSKLKKVLEDVF